MLLAPELTEMEVVSEVMIGDGLRNQASGLSAIRVRTAPLSAFPVETDHDGTPHYALDESLITLELNGTIYASPEELPLEARRSGQRIWNQARSQWAAELREYEPGSSTRINVFQLDLAADRYVEIETPTRVEVWRDC